jgi:hypothetical protein
MRASIERGLRSIPQESWQPVDYRIAASPIGISMTIS